MTLEYKNKLHRERDWHIGTRFQPAHPLNRWPFYSPSRNLFNYVLPHVEAGNRLTRACPRPDRLLVAPVGEGADLPYVKSEHVYALDISVEAISRIARSRVHLVAGDMARLPFPDSTFNGAQVSLFFHHYTDLGFEQFLVELRRVLLPGGTIVVLEPNSYHPLTLVTQAMRRVVGNITGCIEDESPFPPSMLLRAMRRCGFTDVGYAGASFSHNRMPIPVARVLNLLTRPLLVSLRFLAWMCVYWGRK